MSKNLKMKIKDTKNGTYSAGVSKLTRDKREERLYLDLLSNHFDKVTTAEPHPDAIINLIFKDAFDKVLGMNYRKQSISLRKGLKIRNIILERLRKKYGPYINLTHFKIKDAENIRFSTNFNRVFNIKGLGRLYGSPSDLLCGNIFYTTHCLEQLEKRVPEYLYAPLAREIKEAYKMKPTIADIMIGMVMNSNLEYGIWEGFKYINLTYGALVLEDLNDIFIAKTFLTPDMIHRDMEWHAPLLKEGDGFHSFGDVFKHDSIKISKPTFLIDVLNAIFGDDIAQQVLSGPDDDEEEDE